MEALPTVISLIIGLIIGAAFSLLLVRSKVAAATALAGSESGAQIASLKTSLEERTQRLDGALAEAARYEGAAQTLQPYLQRQRPRKLLRRFQN